MQTLTEYQRRQSSQRRPSESKVSRSSDWENVSDETDHLPQTPEEAFGDFTQTKSSALPAATPTPGKAAKLEGLDGSRWVASVLIVLNHFYSDQIGAFAEWGSHWTQFFFCLSGFILAYVELARSPDKVEQQSTLEYVKRRLITTYPTYLLAIAITASQSEVKPTAWLLLPLNILMMHCWVPVCWPDESSSFPSRGVRCQFNQFTTTGWFMSVLVVYWCMLRPLARRVHYLHSFLIAAALNDIRRRTHE